MHWLQHIHPLINDYAVAAVVGFGVVALIAAFKVGAGQRIAFMRTYGSSMMLGVLGGIFGVPFVSLLLWFPVFFVLSHVFGLSNTFEHRMASFLFVCVTVFSAGIIYAARFMLKVFRSSGAS
jgi:hypothetical protein